jgi:hypothetical protein
MLKLYQAACYTESRRKPTVKLRLDKFTIAVLAVVAVLLAVAVVTVNRGTGRGTESYRTDNAPETPVVNAFLALQNGDLATARQQYSKQVLKDAEDDKSTGPLRGEPYYGDAARRMRLLTTRVDPSDSARAYVTVALDTYSTGGPFNSGETWSTERIVEVVGEDGAWKINTPEYFY